MASQLTGNSFVGQITIDNDITIDGDLDVLGALSLGGDITFANVRITGDLVVEGSTQEQNTQNSFLTLSITNGSLINSTTSNALITNLTTTNALITNSSIANTRITNALITNSTTTNFVNTNSSIGTGRITNAILTTGTITNNTVTTATIANARITTGLVLNSTTIALGASAGSTVQGALSVAIGNLSGTTRQGTNAVAIGSQAGNSSQGNFAIAIGNSAGSLIQGLNSIAIGNGAGVSNQHANSIILNASGTVINSTTGGSLFINPIRTTGGNHMLDYNTTTNEVSSKPYVWGQFFSTQDQTINQTAANAIVYQTAGSYSGINFSTGSAVLTVQHRGTYKIGTSILLSQSGGSASTPVFFFKKNGVDIPNSASEVYVPGNNTETLAYAEIIEDLNANDTVELYVYTADTGISVQFTASTANFPAIPGVVTTIYRVN